MWEFIPTPVVSGTQSVTYTGGLIFVPPCAVAESEGLLMTSLCPVHSGEAGSWVAPTTCEGSHEEQGRPIFAERKLSGAT